ncbi:MAG: hypothetical protein EXR68_00395 [Dehalococcoidia bacterium]|nr:hypothetical protein [Dehalococcoidia bacterium]
MTLVRRLPPPAPFAPLAITDDQAMARRWLDALNAAGVPAELRIEDARHLAAARLPLPLGPIFATTLFVLADERARAASLLIDLGWDGRRVAASVGQHPLTTAAWWSGAAAATVSGLAIVVMALLQRM